MISIKFSVSLSKWITLSVFLSVFFCRETELFLAYLAAFIHEGAHALTCFYLGIMPKGISVNVFGIRLESPYLQSSKNKILVSASGPAASFLLFAYLYTIGHILSISGSHYNFFVFANLFIGIINLLPISPLDGGTILKAIFSKYLGIILGNKVYGIISAFFYVFFTCLNVCFAIEKIFNPSLWLILIFVLAGIRRERLYSLVEKQAVFSGSIISQKKIKYIACDAESELLCLASRISSEYTIMVAAFNKERFFGELYQNEITDGIRKHGALCTVKECIRAKREAGN